MTQQLGTIRVVVENVRESRGGRSRIEMFRKAMGPNDPFVRIVLTMAGRAETLPYHVGDEFDLPFPVVNPPPRGEGDEAGFVPAPA